MEKFYLIQSALVTRENFEHPRWENLYLVSSFDEARKACCLAQTRSNQDLVDCSFKFVYRFKIIDVL